MLESTSATPSTYARIASRPTPRAGLPSSRPVPSLQPEQLVRVPVLLVVVDQPRVRRRRDNRVERARDVELARVAVDDGRVDVLCSRRGERLDPVERVEGVAQQEAPRLLDRLAGASVLVAPVGLELRLSRKVEVEMGRAACRASRPREHDPQHIRRRDLIDERPEMEQLRSRPRREPVIDVRGRFGRPLGARLVRRGLRVRPQKVATDGIEVVGTRLHAHQQAVEARDVDARRVTTCLQ